MKISELDANLSVTTDIKEEGAVFASCIDTPFEIRGLTYPSCSKSFYRVPETLFPMMTGALAHLCKYTAGGRVRFRTNSPYVIVKVCLMEEFSVCHMPITGVSGVDIFIGSGKECKYLQTIIPPSHLSTEYDGICFLPNKDNEMLDITVNLPLYNGVNNLHIGLKDGYTVEAPNPYAIERPVVYYGSSITQGGCASRPGNSYNSIVSRWLDCDHINLGFSGNGKGETFIAEYIASLDMSAFVMDYDQNAPNADYLRATHEPFFKVIRAKQPNLPVIFMSMPYDSLYSSSFFDQRISGDSFVRVKARDVCAERRAIVKQTYDNAMRAGDQRVWFIGGEILFGAKDQDACTVDGLHPNDLGFMRMAETLYPVLRTALQA